MYNSKEDLIRMTEFSSSRKKLVPPKKPKRQNKIHSPPMISPSRSLEKDVAPMFAVRKSVRSSSNFDQDVTETISEISDCELPVEDQKIEEILDKSIENLSKSETLTNSQTYRDKIRQRFNKVKDQATKSKKSYGQSTSKEFIRLTVERVKREAEKIDNTVEMTRNNFQIRNSSCRAEETAFFISYCESKTEENIDDPKSKHKDDSMQGFNYQLPQNLTFNIKLSEKDCFFVPDGKPLEQHRKIDGDEPRYLEDEGLYVSSESSIPKRHRNILEKRLLAVDDHKWFNCEGNMEILSNSVVNRCLRPDIITSVGDFTTYFPPQLRTDIDEIVIVKENILELTISTIRFNHHPLFSLEHVLHRKLKDSFEKYSNSVENNTLQKLKNQMEALSHARKTKKDGHKDNLAKEIKNTREEMFKVGKSERENLKSTLELWRALKKLRQQQNYSNTEVKLVIRKEKTKVNVETETQKKFFSNMLRDVLDEHRANFKKKMKEYQKRMKEKDEMAMDSDENSDSLPEKPVYDVNEKSVQYELKKRFEECFKPPGEPFLTLILTEEHEITADPENEKELTRRKTVGNTKIFLKLFCNGVFICKSKPATLNDKFSIEFNEAFSIQLTEVPKSLTVELLEQTKGLLKKKLCLLEIELPPQSVSHLNGKRCAVNFQKVEIVHYKHSAVGSGVKIKPILEENGLDVACFDDSMEVNTEGCLSCSLGWQKPLDCFDSKLPVTNINVEILDKYGAIDESNLIGWIEGRRLDPQDPKNSVLYEYLDATRNGGFYESKDGEKNRCFRLSPFAATVSFCDPIELNRNVRLQYLKLRDQNEIEFDGIVVPNRVKEIPLGPMKDYRKRKALEDFKEEGFERGTSEDRRGKGKRFLRQIHTKIFQKCKGSENNLDYESVMDERLLNYFEQVIKTSFENLLNWFKWTPGATLPLPKIYKPRKLEKDQKSTKPVQTKIEIRILSAKNVPVRKEKKNSSEKHDRRKRRKNTKDENSGSETGDELRAKKDEKVANNKKTGKDEEDKVKPFLVVAYEDFSAKTSLAIGRDPVWNESVVLPLEYHHTDYLNPKSLTGSISIQLFDLIARKTDEANEQANWLGEVTIPVSALTHGNTLKGWFKVRLAQLLLNYDLQSSEELSKSSKLTTANLQHTHTPNCYLEMELSICPSVPHLQPNMEDLPSNDLPYLNEHVITWNRNFNDTFPDKKFSALAIDSNGRTNCITRYIKPLEPPQLKEDEFDITADQCARYVSLIPFTDSNQFYQNVWLRSEQLLDFMIGSTIDHAVTLTCYLLALKLDAWLVLGFGVPHGSTAYVLVREYDREAGTPRYYIYDMNRGEKWELNDSHCPLQRVFCLVNSENVWGNAQKTDDPSLLRFDLSRRFDWWPLFDKNVTAPTNFVNARMVYAIADNSEDLERRIERKLKKKFAKLRPLNRTVWQHRLSELFKNSLRQFEINHMYKKSCTEAFLEINKTTSQYSVNGLAINLAFSDMLTLVKKIKNLNMHMQIPNITEFVLSVFVQSYQGDVLSIWIFLGTVLGHKL